MGNTLSSVWNYLFHQQGSNTSAKLSVNCACFNSKVVDDTDSSSSSVSGSAADTAVECNIHRTNSLPINLSKG